MNALLFSGSQCPKTWEILQQGELTGWIVRPYVGVQVYSHGELIGVRTLSLFSDGDYLHPKPQTAFRLLNDVLVRLGDAVPCEDHKGDSISLTHLCNASTSYYGRWPVEWSRDALLRALSGGLRSRVSRCLDTGERLQDQTLALVRAAVKERYGKP